MTLVKVKIITKENASFVKAGTTVSHDVQCLAHADVQKCEE